jgi:hypothetical protein
LGHVRREGEREEGEVGVETQTVQSQRRRPTGLGAAVSPVAAMGTKRVDGFFSFSFFLVM